MIAAMEKSNGTSTNLSSQGSAKQSVRRPDKQQNNGHLQSVIRSRDHITKTIEKKMCDRVVKEVENNSTLIDKM